MENYLPSYQPLKVIFAQIKRETGWNDTELFLNMKESHKNYIKYTKNEHNGKKIWAKFGTAKIRKDRDERLTLEIIQQNVDKFLLFGAYRNVLVHLVDNNEEITKNKKFKLKKLINSQYEEIKNSVENKAEDVNQMKNNKEYKIFKLDDMLESFFEELDNHDFDDRIELDGYDGLEELIIVGKNEKIFLYDLNAEEEVESKEFAANIFESISEDVVYFAIKTPHSNLKINKCSTMKEAVAYFIKELNEFQELYYSSVFNADEKNEKYDSIGTIDKKITNLLN